MDLALFIWYININTIARSSEIFLWFILIATVFVDVLLSSIIKIEHINPITAPDYIPILKDAFYPFSLLFCGCVAFLMLFPLAGNIREIKKTLFSGMGIASILIMLIVLRTLLLLSGPMVNRYVYAVFFSYSLNEQIKIGIVPSSLISVSIMIKTLIFLYSSITIITNVFSIKKSRPVIILAVIATTVSSYFSFNTGIGILEFFYNIWAVIATVFAVAIPILLLIISLIIRLKKNIKPVKKGLK